MAAFWMAGGAGAFAVFLTGVRISICAPCGGQSVQTSYSLGDGDRDDNGMFAIPVPHSSARNANRPKWGWGFRCQRSETAAPNEYIGDAKTGAMKHPSPFRPVACGARNGGTGIARTFPVIIAIASPQRVRGRYALSPTWPQMEIQPPVQENRKGHQRHQTHPECRHSLRLRAHRTALR